MKLHDRPMMTRNLMILVGMAMLALAGCSQETTVTEANMPAVFDQTADPLDGVLNSTMDYTPADPNQRIDKLAEVLVLDEEQTEALREAYNEFCNGMASLKERVRKQVRRGELNFGEAREQAAALRDTFEAELQVILTPEQYDQLQEMRQNRHRHGKGQCDQHARWEAWLEEIGCDEDQIAAVMDALEALRAEFHALHDQIKNGELTWEEAKEAAMEHRAEFDAVLQTILTPEQYEALQELRPDRCGR